MFESNEDIKIFGEETLENEFEESQSLVLDLVSQKNNGNLEKARQLGVILAEEVQSNDGEFVFASNSSNEPENSDILLQRRLLLAFVIDYALNVYCPNGIVTEIASSSFFSEIKMNSAGIYEDIRENAAFSYYFLCVRDGEKVEDEIGKTFAELINHKGDYSYTELGKTLYLHFLDLVKDRVAGLEFVLD